VAPTAVTPSREFWIADIQANIEATIGKLGDMIGWEDDNETVAPRALAAKALLLRASPTFCLRKTPSILSIVMCLSMAISAYTILLSRKMAMVNLW